MSTPRFRIRTADGLVVGGPVQGFGGQIQVGGLDRIRVAIQRAETALPSPIFNPRPGFARVFPESNGAPVDVPLAGATVEAVP